jgi:hypothetical protein
MRRGGRLTNSSVQTVPDLEFEMVNGAGLAAVGAAQLSEGQADLAQLNAL